MVNNQWTIVNGQWPIVPRSPLFAPALLSLLLSFPDPHFHPDLADIPAKKPELASWNTDNNYGQRPYKGDKKDINERPEPILLDCQGIHDLFTQKTRYTATNGKSGDDQRQLPAIYLPFFL